MSLVGALIGGAANLVGAGLNAWSTNEANQDNYARQKEFAKNGIRWKVADAQAAGIHPALALGGSTTSFSPSFVGDSSLGNGLADTGQDISRAISATRTQEERLAMREQAEYQKQANLLDLENRRLSNDLLAAQIRRENSAQLGPGMPSNLTSGPVYVEQPGKVAVGNPVPGSGRYKVVPAEIVSPSKAVPSREAGPARPGFVPTRIGGRNGPTIDLPNSLMSEGLEAMGAPAALAAIGAHNAGLFVDNFFRGGYTTEHLPMPPSGYQWKWNLLRQKWEVRPINFSPRRPASGRGSR